MSRANGYTSYRGSSLQARPSSADLVDLHVYIVPPDIWREQYNNLLNQNVTETVSAGIIRVHPEVKVYSLREEIDQQIGAELLPQDYVFLKSVGRSITRLKPKQEYQLKAKHFIPPQAYAPEIFLLEVGPGDSRGSTGPHSPSIGQPYNSQSYHHPESEDGSQTGKNRHLRSTTSPYRYSPLPKIKQTRTSSKESHRHDYGSHNGDTRGSREGVRGSQSRVSSRARSPPQTDRPQQVNKPHQSDRTPHTDRPSYSDKPPSQPRSRPNSQPRERPTSDNRRSDSRNRPPSDNRSRQRSRERSRASSRHQSPARQGSPTTGHNSASPTPSSDRERDHDHHRDRRHQDRSPHKQEKYDGTYTNHTNEDSGINVITPEEHYEALDRRKPEEHRQPEVHARLQPTHDDDDDERQRRSQEDREREEWERRRREEEERRRIEEEEKRRREQEDQQREDDEQRRREEERDRMTKDQKLTGSDEEKNIRSNQQTRKPPDVVVSSEGDTNQVQSEVNTDRNSANYQNNVKGQNSYGQNRNGHTPEDRPENFVSQMSERDDVFVESVTPERHRSGHRRGSKDQYGEVRYPDNDLRSIHYEDDRLSNLSHPSRHSYVDGNMSDASNSSRVVVQINDEIMGKITPRVIVSINGNDYSKGEVGRTSYVKNRLKPYENGYLSGDTRYDSDHSVHSDASRASRYSNGRVSNRSRVADRAKSSLRRSRSDGNVSNGVEATNSNGNRSQNGTNADDRRRDVANSDSNKDSTKSIDIQKSDKERNMDNKIDKELNGNTNNDSVSSGKSNSQNGKVENSASVKLREDPKVQQEQTATKESNEGTNTGLIFHTGGYGTGHVTTNGTPSGKTNDDKRNGTFVEENPKSNVGSGTYRKGESEQDTTRIRSRNGILQSRTDTVDEDGNKKKAKEVKWSDEVKPSNEDEENSRDKITNVSANNIADEMKKDNEIWNSGDVPSDWSFDNSASKFEASSVQNDKTGHGQEPNQQSTDNKGVESKDKENEELKKHQTGLSAHTVDNSHSFVKSDSDTVQSSHYHGDISDLGEGHPDGSQRRKVVKKAKSDKDLNRFPSPPPMQVHDVHSERETESAKRRRKEEKERLLRELEAAREARRVVERQREELVKKAKAMQSKTQNRRNHADVDGEEDSEEPSDDDEARDVWKKRYFEEKKRTPPLEEQCNRLRTELDIIHRKLMNTLEGPSKDKSTRGDMKPSQKNNYKIQATRLTHEIDDMRRRLENAKMKLTAEMKLRNQAETELRALRAELTQKKIHLTLTRNQQLAALTPGSSNQDLYMMPALTPKS